MLKSLLVAAATFLASGTTLAQSSDVYDTEIMAQVVDPCFMASVQRNNLDEFITEAQALELIKLIEAESIVELVEAIRPLVQGKDEETRGAVYKISLAACVSGAEQ